MNQALAGKFYKAKIFRLATVYSTELAETRDAASCNLVTNITEHTVTGKQGVRANVPVLFSAVLRDASGHTLLPVAMSFSPSANGRLSAASLGQIALGFRVSKRERVLSFLSTVDYLSSIGKLPQVALETHIARITAAGTIEERKAFCDEYPEFCGRAAKDLPYDDSLKVLAYLKYSDMAAA